MAPYATNPDGLVRTPTEAIDLVRSHGVHIPEDVNPGFIKDWTRADADAEYFYQARSYKPDDWVHWDDFYHPETGKIPVRFNSALLNSDEALVAHFSHEMHELNSLRPIFEANGGAIRARTLNELIAPQELGGFSRNLHEQAWDVADRAVHRMRHGGAN